MTPPLAIIARAWSEASSLHLVGMRLMASWTPIMAAVRAEARQLIGDAMPSTVVSVERSGGRRVRPSRLVAAALIILVVTGCADQTATSTAPAPAVSIPAPTTSPAYSPELCSAAARLRASVNALVTLDVKNVGTDGVKQALEDVKSAADDLVAASRVEFGPQAAELESALASLQDAIAGLGGQDGVADDLGAIGAALGAVQAAAKPILDGVQAGC